ncbi:MAG: GNAT family N-acetyltransferase, partial [Pseudomonadota bacterium]
DKISKAIAGAGIRNGYVEHANYWEFNSLDGEAISSCELQTSKPISYVGQFEVEEEFQGRGVARIMLQTISSHFEAEGAKLIEIEKVQSDGLSFWARYGAIPNNGAPEASEYISIFLPVGSTQASRLCLSNAYERALSNPIEAWYEITDPDNDVPRKLIADLNYRSYKKSMTIDLSHPVVRERLGLDQS